MFVFVIAKDQDNDMTSGGSPVTTLSTATLPSPRWLADAGNGAILGDRKADSATCQRSTKARMQNEIGSGSVGAAI